MQSIWNTIFYQPILNALSFTIDKITFGDLGFAIIVLTILIKIILSPLTQKSIKSQLLMKKMEPELKEIRKNFPNKEEQAKKTFELYKKYNTNPFSGCFVVLIQIPFIIALYYVFFKGLNIDSNQLYSFISLPEYINSNFLGIIDLHGKNIFLAILAGGAQFLQGYLANPSKPKVEIIKEGEKPENKTFQEELANSMQTNIKYFLPVMIVYFSYITSAAVSLYWFTSTMFTVLQEWYVRRQFLKNNK